MRQAMAEEVVRVANGGRSFCQKRGRPATRVDAAQIDAVRSALCTEEGARDRLRAAYEAIGIGSTDPAFAHAVTAYAGCDMRCDQLETALKRLVAEAARERRRPA